MSQVYANYFEQPCIYSATAIAFFVANQFQEDSTSQVWRIMIFSQLMLDCDQKGTDWFVNQANLLAAQILRPELRLQIAGNSGSTGLCRGESPYPMRA